MFKKLPLVGHIHRVKNRCFCKSKVTSWNRIIDKHDPWCYNGRTLWSTPTEKDILKILHTVPQVKSWPRILSRLRSMLLLTKVSNVKKLPFALQVPRKMEKQPIQSKKSSPEKWQNLFWIGQRPSKYKRYSVWKNTRKPWQWLLWANACNQDSQGFPWTEKL